MPVRERWRERKGRKREREKGGRKRRKVREIPRDREEELCVSGLAGLSCIDVCVFWGHGRSGAMAPCWHRVLCHFSLTPLAHCAANCQSCLSAFEYAFDNGRQRSVWCHPSLVSGLKVTTRKLSRCKLKAREFTLGLERERESNGKQLSFTPCSVNIST